MRILAFVLAIALALLLIGCDGEVRHNISTGEFGSLMGLMITPEPQTLDISTDEVFYLDWEDGYKPPSEFTVKLESVDSSGDKTGVLTTLETISRGHYRLEPTWYLSEGEFYILTITGNGDHVKAIYLTEDFLSMTRNASQSGGQVEHTVKTAP